MAAYLPTSIGPAETRSLWVWVGGVGECGTNGAALLCVYDELYSIYIRYSWHSSESQTHLLGNELALRTRVQPRVWL